MSARVSKWETEPIDSNGLLIVTKNNCCHLFVQLERIAFEVTRIMFVENLRCTGPGNICYSSILVVYTCIIGFLKYYKTRFKCWE